MSASVHTVAVPGSLTPLMGIVNLPGVCVWLRELQEFKSVTAIRQDWTHLLFILVFFILSAFLFFCSVEMYQTLL